MRSGIVLSLLIIATACKEIPADPNRSFEKAIGTGLSVGYSVNPPWVTEKNGTPGGIEPGILNAYARSAGIKIVWEKGSEQVLLEKLEKQELHLVIAGLTKDTPWKSRKIGLTKPYRRNDKTRHVMAIQQGENRLLMNIERYFQQNMDSLLANINEENREF